MQKINHKEPDKFLREYISQAPLALAFERAQECYLYPDELVKPKVLDFGCGDGIFNSIAFRKKIECGLDLNYRELLSAKKTGSYQQLINASGYALPFKNEIYRTIIANSVVEHIPDLDRVLIEFRRILSPSGIIFLTIPTSKFDEASLIYNVLGFLGFKRLQKEFKKIYNKFWKHYHYYTVEEWYNIFQKAGFKDIKLQTYESKKMALMNDALVIFSGFSFMVKKITNRFIIFPKFRKEIFSPFFSSIEKIISKSNRLNGQGVLLFCTLKKG